ncbi:MAG: AAA family ATPase [Slackia sp.]
MAKDDNGSYLIPIERQRPLFLLGAPGLGKTAIMEQVAQEMGIGLVSYSMTHHTRQSALGLPYIAERTFEGRSFSVSEYTMSEIIASIYESMGRTGRKEGILFLTKSTASPKRSPCDSAVLSTGVRSPCGSRRLRSSLPATFEFIVARTISTL